MSQVFICPVKNPRLTSKYDPFRPHPVLKGTIRKHAGIDLVDTKVRNAPILATADGTVRLVKTTKDGYGKHMILSHTIGGQLYESCYAHLDGFNVKQGQTVKQGQQIATMGNTGIGTGIHLHFEIHRGLHLVNNFTYPNAFDPLQWVMGDFKMKISEAGLDLIKKWEGFKGKAYVCPAGKWTIGYGTTKWPNGKAVKSGETITEKEAAIILEQQVNEHSKTIFTYVKVALNQNQFDALASFQYNLGPHILKGSNLVKALNKKDWVDAARLIGLYNKATNPRTGKKEVLEGLNNRRKDEVALFTNTATAGTGSNTLQKERVRMFDYSSDALKKEHEVTRDSAARREMIVEAAIAAGYNEAHWREKLAEGKVTADDADALAAGTLVKLATKK